MNQKLMNHTTYKINVTCPWYDFIQQGKKVYEGRLNKEKFKNISINDEIIIYENDNNNNNDDNENNKINNFIKSKVINIYNFSCFEEMLNVLPIHKILPAIDTVYTIQEGIEIYRQFYSEKNEKLFGVIAFELEVMNNNNNFI